MDTTQRKQVPPSARGGGHAIHAAIEREVFETAYDVCHRNQVHTAGLPGITRNVLRALLKRFGMLRERAVLGQSAYLTEQP